MVDSFLKTEQQGAIQCPHQQRWSHSPEELPRSLFEELSHCLGKRLVVDLLTENSLVDREGNEGGEGGQQAGHPSIQEALEIKL